MFTIDESSPIALDNTTRLLLLAMLATGYATQRLEPQQLPTFHQLLSTSSAIQLQLCWNMLDESCREAVKSLFPANITGSDENEKSPSIQVRTLLVARNSHNSFMYRMQHRSNLANVRQRISKKKERQLLHPQSVFAWREVGAMATMAAAAAQWILTLLVQIGTAPTVAQTLYPLLPSSTPATESPITPEKITSCTIHPIHPISTMLLQISIRTARLLHSTKTAIVLLNALTRVNTAHRTTTNLRWPSH
jgi:hypothetical protein